MTDDPLPAPTPFHRVLSTVVATVFFFACALVLGVLIATANIWIFGNVDSKWGDPWGNLQMAVGFQGLIVLAGTVGFGGVCAVFPRRRVPTACGGVISGVLFSISLNMRVTTGISWLIERITFGHVDDLAAIVVSLAVTVLLSTAPTAILARRMERSNA